MPAVAIAPAPSVAPPSPGDLPPIPFIGRSLAEYVRSFALDLLALRGRDVLDVAAGASSFVAEACARKIDAVAVDPVYGRPAGALAAQVERDREQWPARTRANRRLLRLKPSTLAAARLDRRGAAERFLADYATRFAHGRYVGASLPRLPFFDGTFDLVLCSDLLFTNAEHFDFDWHLAACRELARVSSGDVRLHPLCGVDGRPYRALPRLRRELRAGGIGSELTGVEGGLVAGGSPMLVLTKP